MPLADLVRVTALRQRLSLAVLINATNDILVAALDVRQRVQKRAADRAAGRDAGSRRVAFRVFPAA